MKIHSWVMVCGLLPFLASCGDKGRPAGDGGEDEGVEISEVDGDADGQEGDLSVDEVAGDMEPDELSDADEDADDGITPPTYTCEPTRWVTVDAAGGGDGSAEDPWTLAQAMSGAGPGDVVLVGPGVYVAPTTGERYAPAWNPDQSGTDGSPIVFCAAYPAVHHAEGRSELRNDATAEGDEASPTFGTLDRQHIVWDGFYVNEASSPSHPDTGPVVVWGSRHVTIAQSVIEGATIEREDNHNGIRLEAVSNVQLLNNRISGFRPASSTNRNHTGIMTYDASYVTIEHNEIWDCIGGIYLKGDHADDGMPNGAFTVRFNHLHDVTSQAITILGVTQVGDAPSLVSQNLVTLSGLAFLFNSVGPDHPAGVRVTNNTIAGCDAAFMPNARETLFDFHVVGNLVSGCAPFYFEDWTEDQLHGVIANGYLSDDNHAHLNPEWAFGRDLEEWQAFSGLDMASSTGDPEFVNEAEGDYHLSPTSPAATASISGGAVGCYMTGDEVMGVEGPP